jgi:hypothetical protein
VAAVVFFAWLGYPVSNFAMMVMISIHAGSILRIQHDIGFVKRVMYSLLTFLAVATLLYMPARDWMERHWFAPLTVNGRVIVIRPGQRPGAVQRGDWIAYQLADAHGYGVVVRGGCTLGRVLAVAGDEVSFGRQQFVVNGVSQTRLPDMPTNGTVVVKQGCWFIWPNLRASGHGDAGATAVADMRMQLAIVPETRYVGVPCRRWLWRRQTAP